MRKGGTLATEAVTVCTTPVNKIVRSGFLQLTSARHTVISACTPHLVAARGSDLPCGTFVYMAHDMAILLSYIDLRGHSHLPKRVYAQVSLALDFVS